MKKIFNYFSKEEKDKRAKYREEKKAAELKLKFSHAINTFEKERERLLALRKELLDKGYELSIVEKQISISKRVFLYRPEHRIILKEDVVPLFKLALGIASDEEFDTTKIYLGSEDSTYNSSGFWVYGNYAFDIKMNALYYYNPALEQVHECKITICEVLYRYVSQNYFNLTLRIDKETKALNYVCLEQKAWEAHVQREKILLFPKFRYENIVRTYPQDTISKLTKSEISSDVNKAISNGGEIQYFWW